MAYAEASPCAVLSLCLTLDTIPRRHHLTFRLLDSADGTSSGLRVTITSRADDPRRPIFDRQRDCRRCLHAGVLHARNGSTKHAKTRTNATAACLTRSNICAVSIRRCTAVRARLEQAIARIRLLERYVALSRVICASTRSVSTSAGASAGHRSGVSRAMRAAELKPNKCARAILGAVEHPTRRAVIVAAARAAGERSIRSSERRVGAFPYATSSS